MNNEKMALVLNKMEEDLLYELKQNEKIIKVPIKVGFNEEKKLTTIYLTNAKILFEEPCRDNERMTLLLNHIEKDLLNEVNDNDDIIKVPVKVEFDNEGRIINTSDIHTNPLFEGYNN